MCGCFAVSMLQIPTVHALIVPRVAVSNILNTKNTRMLRVSRAGRASPGREEHMSLDTLRVIPLQGVGTRAGKLQGVSIDNGHMGRGTLEARRTHDVELILSVADCDQTKRWRITFYKKDQSIAVKRNILHNLIKQVWINDLLIIIKHWGKIALQPTQNEQVTMVNIWESSSETILWKNLIIKTNNQQNLYSTYHC